MIIEERKHLMIFSIDIGQVFDKIQNPFMIKKNKTLKNIYNKLKANITLNGKKPESFPPKIKMSTLATSIQYCTTVFPRK